ncbi:caspase family protein [Methylobacterium sp. NEAU 140]|uniref:caspase family protein n=1 Tax=Methylobacterium sp. NEAU 140 TaxID=3064945 RepID=UPI002737671A|nr:caspase family protein [Methylobacterium sp. NEAU 140]MDP4021205.1 caspase family protein [Methylobacterium sp. NEAU 140]
MTRFAIAMLVSALLTLFAEQASAEGRRVALVVGVGAYQSVPKLPNAVNDANAMAELFRASGFEVVTARNDVSNLEFKRAIREFEDAANESDIAVVYYAGHGIEIRETNYLIPTDAKLINERDAEDEAISLDRILNALEPAKRLRLVILDACRDNPFAGKMKRRVATRAITAGLGKVEPQQTDTLIAYAAKAQAVANDGEGAHSPFTTALLANLAVPGLDIRLAFGRVRDDVLKATNRQQEPFVYGSLGGGTVALVPARVQTAALTPMANTRTAEDLAKSDYEIVERVGTKAAWEVYLNTHKAGLYADLARVQIAKFASVAPEGVTRVAARTEPGFPSEGGTQVSPRTDVPAVLPAPKPTAAEIRAWDKLKTSTDAAAIRKFIDTHASSPLIPEAQDRLATVERLAREKEERVRQERDVARLREEDERQKKAAEAERKLLEKEAARQREEAEKAKAAEAARQKAEAQAAARQREAEERARAAEAAARKREEEETARLAEMARRRKEAEERAAALAAERAKIEAEIAVRKREAEEAARAAAVAKAAREAEEKARQQALKDQQRQDAETATAAAAAAAASAAREAAERERVKAAETAARQKEAEDRRKAAEAERAKAEAAVSAEDKAAAEAAKVAEAERRKAKAAAEAERRKAEAAAEAAAEQKAERAAAARRREAAEERRREAEEAAAANRRKAETAARRAAERQAEQAAALPTSAAAPRPPPRNRPAPAPPRPPGRGPPRRRGCAPRPAPPRPAPAAAAVVAVVRR